MKHILPNQSMDIQSYLAQPISASNLQQVSCPICKSILLEPVVCGGTCESVFCRKCAMNWKQTHGACPRTCSVIFKFSPVAPPEMQFRCPYSNQCAIKTHQVMLKHFDNCSFLPMEYQRLAQIKQINLCPKGHRLLLYTDYPKFYNTECGICQAKHHCRHYCTTCNLMYCIKCRPVICSKEQPPVDKEYIRHTSFLEIRGVFCDGCGLKPQFGSYSIRKDKECEVNICDYCFCFLPRALPQAPPYSSHSECLNHHSLQLLPKVVKNKCGSCYNVRECQKHCCKCKQYYCLVCKKLDMVEQTCERKHTFTMESIKSMKITNPVCKECNHVISPTKYYFFDKQCNLLICKPCFRAGKLKQHNKHSIKGREMCGHPNHTSYLNLKQTRVVQECVDCERLVEAKYLCKQCSKEDRKKIVCFKCQKLKERDVCLLGHKMSDFPGNTGKICQECGEHSSKGKICTECQYVICSKCH